MRRNRTTLKDVAAQAGVSVGTAYNALSGKSPVSEEARNRVATAAASLNYKVSDFGRRLRTGKSRNLVLISSIPSAMSGWFVMDMLNAAIDEASHHGYTLSLIRPTPNPRQALELIEKGVADGSILMQIRQQDERIELLQRGKVPFVALGRTADPGHLNWVDFDIEAATYKAFEYLAHLGHRRVGFIAPASRGPRNDLGVVMYMSAGLERAVHDFGLEVAYHDSLSTIEAGAAAAEALLDANPGLTAVFASYGSTHFGVLQALHKRRLSVPDDVSVIAITSEQSAVHTIPRLTSVDIPQHEMGRAAVRQLIHKLEGEPALEQALLAPNLIVRDSTAPPRTGAKTRRGRG